MKLLPLPLEPVVTCRTLATADVLTFGATMGILLRWWQSGCGSLPETDAGLAALAGCSSRRWRAIRENVRQALADINPMLAEQHARQSEVAKNSIIDGAQRWRREREGEEGPGGIA